MKKEKILVIGSNSFSGSHFVTEALRENHRVWGVSRSPEPDKIFLPYKWSENTGKILENSDNFTFKALDLNKDLSELIKLIDDVKPEIIVNFAAQGMVAESWVNPTHWYQTNVVAQVALHDELRKRKFIEKYVHVTTPEVYGSTDKGWITENNIFNPSTPYAVSRAACDMHLQSFFRTYNFPVIFTRAANVYGPGQQLYRIIPKTIASALTGKRITLHGGGKSSRSFIHAKDVAKATLTLSLKGEPGSSWHISTDKTIEIRELVEKIFKLCNVDASKYIEIGEERLGKDQNYLLDSKAIRRLHGWNDTISLDAGLKETLRWATENIDVIKSLPWQYVHKI